MQTPVAEAFASLLRADPTAPVAWTVAGTRDRAALAVTAAAWRDLLAAVPPEARVAVSVRDDWQFLAAVLAIWQGGGCAVLLDAADPQAPRADQARRCGAYALLADEPVPRCELLASAAATPPVPAGPFAAIKLTSGSTDEPRAVGVGTAHLVADGDGLMRTMGITVHDRLCAAVPMSFSYGTGSLLVPALWRGIPLVLPERHALGLLPALRLGEPTVLPAVPALVRALLAGSADLPKSLRLVVSAGALLPPEVAVAFRQRFGRPVHAFYGATEAGGICYDRDGGAAERGSVGTPVDGAFVELAADGRVRVAAPTVGFALEPCADLVGGVFTAPDLGAFRDGELVLQGRQGLVIDCGGHKVHPREVERVIESLRGVTEAAVVPWRDGDGRATCAALVASGSTALDEGAVRRHCIQHLAAAKVPRCIVVVRELPRSCRGKLQRADLERLLAAGGFGAGFGDSTGCERAS